MRLRVKYSISGKIRFISHLDLMRAFFRACIKKDIPVSVSQGFSPHLKISFGPPLSLGMSSSEEFLDMYMSKPVDLGLIKNDLQEGLPEGIKVEDVYEVPKDIPSLSVSLNMATYKVKVPEELLLDIEERIKRFSNPLVSKLEVNDGQLVMDVSIGQKGNIRPIDVLQNLWPELDINEIKLWPIHREKLYNGTL